MTAHLAAAVHHACCVAVANHESNAGAHAPVDHRSKTSWARKGVDPFINPEEKGFAMKSDENTKPRSELPVIMQQWKSDVFRGAAAADDASDCLGRLLDDSGQRGVVVDGLTRADLLAKPDYGVFGPDKFWGHVLTGPTATDKPENFEARVERAWRFMRTMFFTTEEHAALVEAMVRLCGSQDHAQNQNQG